MYEAVQWLSDGSPHSPRFNDRYRSRSGALAQALAVYLGGCGLPARWRGRSSFTVLETGFGLGLNFLATWAAWEADPERCARLQFVSVEAYPPAASDILRNVSQPDAAAVTHPNLSQPVPLLAKELATVWPGLRPGIQQLDFAGGSVQLTLAWGQVQPMLQALSCEADAVYLDGFSPALNPEMWSLATLRELVRHCRTGTLLASYSVALQVRENLKQLGFEVRKCPGLPPKRHRLQACYAPA